MSDDQKTLQEVMQEALSKHPHLRAVSEFVDKEVSTHVRDGKMSLPEAMARLRKLSGDKSFNALVQKGMGREEEPLDGLIHQEEEGRPLGLNPLLLGQIMERLQFDGDVPEMRGEHMLDGGTPAVPVVTDTMDPVVLGLMLSQASEEVAEEFRENAGKLSLQVQAEWEALEDKSEEKDAEGPLVATEGDAPLVPGVYERPEVDPEGYKRGQLPALRKVGKPSGSALVQMSAAERHELAWKSFSTTQGRRSSVSPIATHLLKGLEKKGLRVRLAKQKRKTLPLAAHEWTIHLDGPQATQTGFAPVAVAAEVLLQQLLQKLKRGDRDVPLYLQVSTVDEISQRLVGWAAELHLGAWK